MIVTPQPVVICDGCGDENCVDAHRYTPRQWMRSRGWKDEGPYQFCPGCAEHVEREWSRSAMYSDDGPPTWSGHLDRMTRKLPIKEDA